MGNGRNGGRLDLMPEAPLLDRPAAIDADELDVLIVGAGISGVSAGYHLQTQRPGTRFAMLEAQPSYGGTWYTHRYPGIRSDSDLYTFGYRFKPWTGAPIATAEEIRKYMGEVIAENGLDRHIRYQHRIRNASWSSQARRWTLEGERTDTGEPVRFRAPFLFMCQGYYRHEDGYMPRWDGMDAFAGQIIHSMHWPDAIDLAGKRVVVIGSGASAATIVPNIAGKCAHVTMLQRTPIFYRTGRNAIEIADELRRLEIDETWIHEIVRRKILYESKAFTDLTFTQPDRMRAELLGLVRDALGDGAEAQIAEHFTPTHRPWQQRIAFVPDGDLFRAIREGHASVKTGHIDRFVADGIQLTSGEVLPADVIVAATGFHLNVLGDIDFTIDGRPLVLGDTVTYRGMMSTGVPNLAYVFGYFRSSWTLRADLVSDFVCRLLAHMAERGAEVVEPRLRPEDAGMKLGPWVDADNFNPGYINRGQHLLPQCGDKIEWRHTHDYWTDKNTIPTADLEDGTLTYR